MKQVAAWKACEETGTIIVTADELDEKGDPVSRQTLAEFPAEKEKEAIAFGETAATDRRIEFRNDI